MAHPEACILALDCACLVPPLGKEIYSCRAKNFQHPTLRVPLRWTCCPDLEEGMSWALPHLLFPCSLPSPSRGRLEGEGGEMVEPSASSESQGARHWRKSNQEEQELKEAKSLFTWDLWKRRLATWPADCRGVEGSPSPAGIEVLSVH